MKNAGILTLCAAAALAVSCVKKESAPADDGLALVAETDASMNRAIAEAQRTLPDFVKRYSDSVPGDSNFAVKVMVKEPAGVEHLWVSFVEITDSLCTGIVDSDPQFVKSVKQDSVITFDHSSITDWAYTDSTGVRQGAFTVKVLLRRMTSEQADQYRKLYGWTDTTGAGFESGSGK